MVLLVQPLLVISWKLEGTVSNASSLPLQVHIKIDNNLIHKLFHLRTRSKELLIERRLSPKGGEN